MEAENSQPKPHMEPIGLLANSLRGALKLLINSRAVHEEMDASESCIDQREITDEEAAQATADAAMRHAEIYHQRPYLGRF